MGNRNNRIKSGAKITPSLKRVIKIACRLASPLQISYVLNITAKYIRQIRISICGIYKITCLGNNKVYIGSSSDVKKRLSDHKNKLLKNRHENKHLQNTFNIYGQDKFLFEIIDIVDKEEKLYEFENQFFSLYKSTNSNFGFNIQIEPSRGPGLYGEQNPAFGQGEKFSGELNHFYGKKHSEKTKQLISKANSGRAKTLEERAKLSAACKGKNAGEKHKCATLKDSEVSEIKKLYRDGWRNKDLASKFNVSRSVIGYILTNRTWKHIK